MTIHQIKGPCFMLDPSPYGDDDYGIPHYATYPAAAKALTGLREERAPDPEDLAKLKGVQVKQEDGPCWVADCDAFGCEERYEDDDGGGSHFGSVAEVEEWMGPDGWTYRGGDVAEFWPAPGAWTRMHTDEVFCPGCRPADCRVPPSTPRELEAAGQLVLPGVLP